MNYRNMHQMNLYEVFGQNQWDEEDEFAKDREYMRKMYTPQGRALIKIVEDLCDQQEYDGSCMYDEYPDLMALSKMAEQIYDAFGKPDPEEIYKAMIMTMLHDELCYRRWRRRTFKKRLYMR